jgi:thiol:disulfide interchange protein DsbD
VTSAAEPPAKVVQDPFYNEPRAIHEKGSRFVIRSDIPFDETGLLRIRFEACSVNTCLLPSYFLITARKGEVSRPEPRGSDIGLGLPSQLPTSAPSFSNPQITPAVPQNFGSTRPAPSLPDVRLTDTLTAQVQKALGTGSWILFPALFLAGLLMNLTPCVYPMIPITLNVLAHAHSSNKNGSESKEHPMLHAFLYVVGIVLAYAGMGVIAGMTGSLFGGLLQSRVFNLFLAALMFFLGLSMLGVVDLSRLQNLGNRIPLSKQSPKAAVLTMGAVSGLVAAPCTGPVLSLLLILVGQTKDPLYGFTLMSVFASGFGAPYLVLGLLSHHIKRLPRAGRLMNLVKNIFAALMFALALYYLKSVLTQIPLFALLYAQPSWVGVFTIAAVSIVFLFWQHRSANHPITTMGAQTGLTLLALWLTLSAIKGFVPMEATALPSIQRMGSPVEIPPSVNNTSNELVWYKDWKKAVQAAQIEKKGLLVDAWAQWCAACLKMDAELWTEEGVKSVIQQRFVALKVDFTESNPDSEDLTKRWDLAGLPAVGFYPAGSDFTSPPAILFREGVTVIQFHQAVQKLINGEFPTTPSPEKK